MLLTPLPTLILVRLKQDKKAESPMLTTLSGIVMFVRVKQFPNASSPMLVTGLPSMVGGITSSPVAASSQSVMVTFPSVVV
jgi:hypothetical protein